MEILYLWEPFDLYSEPSSGFARCRVADLLFFELCGKPNFFVQVFQQLLEWYAYVLSILKNTLLNSQLFRNLWIIIEFLIWCLPNNCS